MQLKIQVIIAVALLLLFGYIIRMIQKRSLEVKYALSWMGAIVALLIFDVFPPIMNWLASLFGIAVPSNWLFILGFCFFIVLVLALTIALSKLSNKNKELIQEVALLKRRVELLEKANAGEENRQK